MIRSIALAAVSSVVLGSVAFAADLPSSKGPPVYAPPPPVFSWTGAYVGAQVGYEWGHTGLAADATALGGPIIGLPGFSDDGIVGGGHVGYNLEIGQTPLIGLGGLVVGIEGDVNGASYTGSEIAGAGLFAGLGTRERTEIDGSVRGRVGLAFDRFLVYGTGGAAFGSIRDSIFAPGFAGEAHDTGRVGWTAGGGVEYAFDNNWSARVEYRYTDYGHYDVGYAALPFSLRYHPTDNRVQAGFSYKFDMFEPPAPVVAKY